MHKTITNLTDEQKYNLITSFLKNLGERLKAKRKNRSITQEDLADCLGIDHTTISKYETGDRDMQVSMLPLFSTYCNFPLYELFPRDESRAILDTFAKAVSITVDRKKRQEEMHEKKAIKAEALRKRGREKILKGQLFEIDGQEVFEPVPPKRSKSLRDRYKDAEMHTEYAPYSQTEFCNYVTKQKEELVDSVVSAGQLLNQIEDLPKKETLKNVLADYIVDELVINQVARKHPDEMSRRAYAYYRRLYLNYQDQREEE